MSTTLETILTDLAGILVGAGGYHVTKVAPRYKVVKRSTVRTASYTCYDAWTVDNLPPNGEAYLGYVGAAPDNFEAVSKAHYPKAHIISITINHLCLAEFYDVERGGGSVADMTAWFHMCVKHGIYRPGFYASRSNTQVWELADKLTSGKITPRKFCADWTGTPHIPAGFDACQYKSTPTYDESSLSPTFFPSA